MRSSPPPRTDSWEGAPVVRLDEVDSTQIAAREMAERVPDGTCVVAARQTAGHGRLGRAWLAPAEGLALSVVLHPRCAARHAPRLTLGAAAGALDALSALGVEALVKWPNDLVIRAPAGAAAGRLGPFRKVGGVLIEVVRMGALLDTCVLGVGVNVKAPAEGWPEDIANTAGALADAGFSGGAGDVLAAVRARMPDALAGARDDFGATLAKLRARSATLGRRVTVDGVTGLAHAIDEEGALVLVDDAGASHTVRAGDVWMA